MFPTQCIIGNRNGIFKKSVNVTKATTNMNTNSDDMILHFQKGDWAAFQQTFDKYSRELFYFVKKQVGEDDTAEDIIMETFNKLYRLHTNFETEKNIKAFLYISARNASLDHLRYRNRRKFHHKEYKAQMTFSEMPAILEENYPAELLKKTLWEIKSLPPRPRQTIEFYLQGLSNVDIAEILGVGVHAVQSYKSKAQKLLKARIRENSTSTRINLIKSNKLYNDAQKGKSSKIINR
jgi:RNA polymerase sigma factor (sigma-70 family)